MYDLIKIIWYIVSVIKNQVENIYQCVEQKSRITPEVMWSPSMLTVPPQSLGHACLHFQRVESPLGIPFISVQGTAECLCMGGTTFNCGGDVAMPVTLEGRVSNQRELFLSLNTPWNLPCCFWSWNSSLLPVFLLLPIEIGMLSPCLPYNCMLEAYNLCGITGSQGERNFASV